jgi:hypothetical protein
MLLFSEDLISSCLVQEVPHYGLLCVLCGYTHRHLSMMKRHIEGKHSRTAGYKCPICSRELKTSHQRQMHVKKAHDLMLSSADIMAMESNRMQSGGGGGGEPGQ